jgi:hypothetical protein
MSTNRGIFDQSPDPQATHWDSPFGMAPEETSAAAPARVESPFMIAEESSTPRPVEPGRPAKLPERRKPESPFQLAEPLEGFGLDGPPSAWPTPAQNSPFSQAPSAFQGFAEPHPFAATASPAEPVAAPSVFAAGPAGPPSLLVPSAFAFIPDPAPAFTAAPVFAQTKPQAPAPTFTASPAAPAPSSSLMDHFLADSSQIRQLELRAIFGVDREMSPEESLERARELRGIRSLARVSAQDIGTIESFKNLLPGLGFGAGSLRIFSGAAPVEFIQEAGVALAVQVDGGFAPGVRETLIIVARELARLA